MNSKGFSVAEVLIAGLLMAILAAAATPSFLALIQKTRLRSATEALYQHLLQAKNTAITGQSNVLFTLNTGTLWCYGSRTDSACNCQISNACPLGQDSAAHYSGITITANGSIAGGTTFKATKGQATQSGTISMTLGDYTTKVSINNAGSLSICSNNDIGYEPC